MCNIPDSLINKLKPGEFIVENNEVHVKAHQINNGYQMYFKCPFCCRYKKNGEKMSERMAHHEYHEHTFEKGRTYLKKSPHCKNHHNQYGTCFRFFPTEYIQFCIHVTNETLIVTTNKKDYIIQ